MPSSCSVLADSLMRSFLPVRGVNSSPWMNPEVSIYCPHTPIFSMKNKQQSAEIKNLKAQLQRANAAQLSEVVKWENPNRVVVEGRSVPGWAHDEGVRIVHPFER